MKKKILSIVLTFSMLISVLTILPIQIGATEGNATEIGSVEKWLELSQEAELTGDYVLTADLEKEVIEFISLCCLRPKVLCRIFVAFVFYNFHSV